MTREEPQVLEPGLRRLTAPNPSPMTFRGTNTYILGEGAVAIIDPGPEIAAHFDAILAALSSTERVTQILVTHAHADHSPLSRRLAQATGAPVLGFGPPDAGRRPIMADLARSGGAGGGEGVDLDFAPDIRLADGDTISGDGWRLTALHTPGHFPGHLAFAWRDRLFCGDHVMGWSTSLVSPPDGDMLAYMASLDRLAGGGWARFYPGHGDPIGSPAARIAELTTHRRQREAAIVAALASGPLTAADLTAKIYTDTPAALLPAAERNVLAHLIALCETGRTRARPTLSATATFSVT